MPTGNKTLSTANLKKQIDKLIAETKAVKKAIVALGKVAVVKKKAAAKKAPVKKAKAKVKKAPARKTKAKTATKRKVAKKAKR